MLYFLVALTTLAYGYHSAVHSEVGVGRLLDEGQMEETVGCPMFKCMMYCPNGFEKDANGCDVCMCARAEQAVGKACSRHEDCGVWEYCSFGNGCRRRRAGGHAESEVGYGRTNP